MNWDAIGAVGEMIGATAVVATLWILLLQMRQNTRALHENSRGARRTAADQNFRDLSRFRDMMVRDPELASIWHNGCQGESLADVEAERFMGLLNELIFGLWRGFEGAKNLGDQVYLKEIVRISASAGAFPTIGNRLREIAQADAFRDYAEAVLPLINESDPADFSSVMIYDRIRGQGESR